MGEATLEARILAKELFAQEEARLTPPATKLDAALRSFDHLQVILSKLAGDDGYRSLLSRALSLAVVECAWLNTVRISDDGTLEGVSEYASDFEDAAKGTLIIMEHLIELLQVFIGEPLTLRILGEVWPKGRFGAKEIPG